MILQVLLDPVVVEQRIINVDEDDDRMGQLRALIQCHAGLWSTSSAAKAPATR